LEKINITTKNYKIPPKMQNRPQKYKNEATVFPHSNTKIPPKMKKIHLKQNLGEFLYFSRGDFNMILLGLVLYN
jgi:hypothetical protein